MLFFLTRIIVLLNKFEVVYTGLKRFIGSPVGFNKITFDGDTFKKFDTYDLEIPIQETHQGARRGSSDLDLDGALDGLDGNSVRASGQEKKNSFGNVATNLLKNRVSH